MRLLGSQMWHEPERGSSLPERGTQGVGFRFRQRSKLHEKEDLESLFFPQRYNLPSEQEKTLRAKGNGLNGYPLPPDGAAAYNYRASAKTEIGKLNYFITHI